MERDGCGWKPNALMHDDVKKGKSMSRRMMLSLSLLVILQTTLIAQTAQKYIPPCPCYSLQLGPEVQTVKVGSPISINVMVTNTVDHEVSIEQNSRHPGDVYFVDVIGSQGVRQKKTDNYSRVTNLRHSKVSGESARPMAYRDENGTTHIETYRGSGEPLRTIKPGDHVKYTILLNDLYSLDKAGTYTVQLKRTEGTTRIDSNVVTVTVTN